MDVYEAVDFYKKYSPIHFWGFNNIDAYELLADDWHMIDRGISVKEFITTIFSKNPRLEKKENGEIVFFFNPKIPNNDWAKVHYPNFINAANTCGNKTILTFSGKYKYSIYQFICNINSLIWFIQCTKINLSIKQRLSLIKCLLRIKLDAYEAIKLCKNKKLVVVYSDIYDNGYYLVNELKRMGIKTATMMHSYVSENNFNLTMSHSDYFLANCEVSKLYAIKAGYKENNVYCIGLSSEIGVKERAEDSNTKTFAVILDGGIEQSETIRNKSLLMIDVAEKLCAINGFRYILRYHPGESECNLHKNTKYLLELSESREDIHDLLSRVDFIIVGYTSVMFTAISQCIPFYRCIYNDGHEFDDIVKLYENDYKLDFEDIDSLIKIINTTKPRNMALDIKNRVFGELNILDAHSRAWNEIIMNLC